MKKGFTMIELIFVIVILGILAAVAIPKLAATRDDAKLAAVKTDIGTYMNAIPAWYQGQKDARISQAVSLDTNQWVKTATANTESYSLTLDTTACVTIAVWEMNGTAASATDTVVINASTGKFTPTLTNGAPVFRIIKGTAANPAVYVANTAGTVCETLWNDMGVTEQNITMAGKKVKW